MLHYVFYKGVPVGGAMAGSTLLLTREKRNALRVVTLTINNRCNLKCGHCYLQYSPTDETPVRSLISEEIATHVLSGRFEHLTIVGKEPLADTQSIQRLSEIVLQSQQRGIGVSLITNGLNGALLPSETVRALSWIDVSLDGGPESYSAYRGGSWSKLRNAINSLHASGLRELRVLNTLSHRNLPYIDDMINGAQLLRASRTIFSPFQRTLSDGVQTETPVSFEEFARALRDAATSPEAYCIVDAGYLKSAPAAAAWLQQLQHDFESRLILTDFDPIELGILRVTYDGLVMTPQESIDTQKYPANAHNLLEKPIDDWYSDMLSSSKLKMPVRPRSYEIRPSH